jgi:putative thioredoxin
MQLDQSLQRRVAELGGAVRLGRLNATVEQELAVALKLTQLPTVLGVFGGKMVSSFVGCPDEKVLDEFVDLMLRVGGQNQLVELASIANAALERGEIDSAKQTFADILQDKTLRAEAIALAGLIRCAVKEGKIEEAKELADIISQSYPKDVATPEVQQALTALELSSTGSGSSSKEEIEKLKESILSNPNDMDSRLALASALWASSEQTQAINTIFDMIKIDKNWNDQAARKLLLKFWESLGPENPLTSSSRKRFGAIWF